MTLLDVGGVRWTVRTDLASDLAIPVRFGPEQLQAFGLPAARAEVARLGDFVGSVAEGGSCNCLTVTFNPHGNGTHTEGLGHLLAEPMSPAGLLTDPLLAATLVTVPPAGGVITVEDLEHALAGADPRWLEAVIVRTLPDTASPEERDGSVGQAPYLAPEAAAMLASLTRHVLVDLPSLDPTWDGGHLLAHRAFLGSKADRRTVTELIRIPPGIADGRYALCLQIAAFELDAAPSRPLLYPVLLLP